MLTVPTPTLPKAVSAVGSFGMVAGLQLAALFQLPPSMAAPVQVWAAAGRARASKHATTGSEPVRGRIAVPPSGPRPGFRGGRRSCGFNPAGKAGQLLIRRV